MVNDISGVAACNIFTIDAALREGLVVDEEENEEHRVGGREGDTRYHVDGLRNSNRMRRFFFPNLDETWLKEIILEMS